MTPLGDRVLSLIYSGSYRLRRAVLLASYALRSFVHGLREGYPPCCVLHFALTHPARHAAHERGIRFSSRRPGVIWVPCGWVHEPDLVQPPGASPDEMRLDLLVAPE